MMCNMCRVSRRDLSPVSTQFNLIYITPIHNNSCLQVKTLHYYRKNPNDRTMPYEQALGDTGKQDLPFNRKTQGQERCSHLVGLVGR